MNSHIFMALLLGVVAGYLIHLKGDALDPGKRIYAYILTAAMMFLLSYVPFYIPMTGKFVHGFAWERIEYLDEFSQKILTPERIKAIEAEWKKDPAFEIDPNWVRNAIMLRAYPSRERLGVNLGLLAVLGGAGWWIVPPLSNRFISRRDGRE